MYKATTLLLLGFLLGAAAIVAYALLTTPELPPREYVPKVNTAVSYEL